jgi:hypothetical protein
LVRFGRYVDTGRASVSQVDLGPSSPFGPDVPVNGLTVTQPALFVGKRAEDGGVDVKGGTPEFASLQRLEGLFTHSGLIVLDHAKDVTER